jgi:hypothetical protein
MDQALIPMIQEDLKSKWEGVPSKEGKEIVANTSRIKMDLKFYFFET